jgi:vacuolar-type H+-ATPase subunit D/Vma8
VNSAKVIAEKLEDRRARAAEYLVGLRQMIDRAARLTRESINEGSRQVQAAETEAELDRIIKDCELCERRIGALEVHVSPYRSSTLLGRRRTNEGTE